MSGIPEQWAVNESEINWWTFRFKEKQPERRAYHSSFTWNSKLFVFGGKDISVGHLNSLWCLDLSQIQGLTQGESEFKQHPEWEQLTTTGNIPKPIANHTSVVFENKMYLFGGSGGMCENTELYCLDLNKNYWSVVKPQGMGNNE